MRAALLIALLGLFITEAHARCESTEQVIRLGVAMQSATPARGRAIASLTLSINRELQGRACLLVITDDQLYASTSSVAALQSGSIELTLPSFSDLATFTPDYRVFDLPFAFRDDRSIQRFLTLSRERLNEPLKKFNVKSLAIWQGHFDQISAKRPVFLPDDLAGLKINSESSINASKIINALDGIEQTVAKDQLHAAVKDGRVDAQFTDWIALRDNKTAILHEGVTQTNHAYHGHVLLASQSWWNGLSDRVKGPLSELIARTTKQANLDAEQQQINAKRTIIQAGATVRVLTRRQRQIWISRLKPIWEKFDNRKILEIVQQADRSL